MAFKKVGGPRKYFKYHELNPGDKLVTCGKYLGSEEGKYGIQHIFREPDNQEICLNSAGQLNKMIDRNLVAGSICNIVYDGMITLTTGHMAGKESHQFNMEVDDGTDSPEPQAAAPVAPTKPAAAPVAKPAAAPVAKPATSAGRRKVAAPVQVSEDDITL